MKNFQFYNPASNNVCTCYNESYDISYDCLFVSGLYNNFTSYDKFLNVSSKLTLPQNVLGKEDI